MALGMAWDLGWIIALPLVLLALGGRVLDNKLGTSPLFLIAGLLLSLVVSSLLVYRKIKEISKDIN